MRLLCSIVCMTTTEATTKEAITASYAKEISRSPLLSDLDLLDGAGSFWSTCALTLRALAAASPLA